LLGQLDLWFRKDLNNLVRLTGIVGMMTATSTGLSRTERIARRSAEEAAQTVWGERAGGVGTIARLDQADKWPDDAYVFSQFVAQNARFAADAGKTIAYLDERAPNQATREMIGGVGAAVAKRIGLGL
jgi:hypothetical protein